MKKLLLTCCTLLIAITSFAQLKTSGYIANKKSKASNYTALKYWISKTYNDPSVVMKSDDPVSGIIKINSFEEIEPRTDFYYSILLTAKPQKITYEILAPRYVVNGGKDVPYSRLTEINTEWSRSFKHKVDSTMTSILRSLK